MSETIPRRNLLAAGGGAAAVVVSSGTATAAPARRERGRVPDDPFRLGIASGDPLPNAVVLWTRLAPDPLASDGRGGMPDRPVAVQWEVADDERFRSVRRRGTTMARPENAHAVQVDVRGLQPDRWYYYRFRAGTETSPVGRTRTTPAHGRDHRLRLAVASCQAYSAGHYTAHRHLSDEDLDLVLFLGDYIYPNATDSGVPGRYPELPNADTETLTAYRIRYAQYKTDPHLRAAHARFPWAVSWDDGEVENNWADEYSENYPDVSKREFLRRRAAAFRAFAEHVPLRSARFLDGPNLPLYRTLRFGDLAEIAMLDTRQYRDDQPCRERVAPPCPEQADPARSILGKAQERWLDQSLAQSHATWNVLAQQVFFAQRDLAGTRDLPPSETLYAMDKWDGYPASRERVLRSFSEHRVRNPIVLSGDDHVHWACDVRADFADADSPVVASEFLTTSITSGGDESVPAAYQKAVLAENPHIAYSSGLRGYIRCTVTAQEWRSDYRVMPYVTEPGAPIRTDATFVVGTDDPGLARG